MLWTKPRFETGERQLGNGPIRTLEFKGAVFAKYCLVFVYIRGRY